MVITVHSDIWNTCVLIRVAPVALHLSVPGSLLDERLILIDNLLASSI